MRVVLGLNALWDIGSALFVAGGLPNLHTGMWRDEKACYIGTTMTAWFLVTLGSMRALAACEGRPCMPAATLSYLLEGYWAFIQILFEKMDFAWGAFVICTCLGLAALTASGARSESRTESVETSPMLEHTQRDEAWT